MPTLLPATGSLGLASTVVSPSELAVIAMLPPPLIVTDEPSTSSAVWVTFEIASAKRERDAYAVAARAGDGGCAERLVTSPK